MISSSLIQIAEAVRLAGKRVGTYPAQRRLQGQMKQAFIAQGRRFVVHLASVPDRLWPSTILQEAIGDEDWAQAWAATVHETVDAFTLPLRAAAESALAAGIRQQLGGADIDIAFNVSNPAAVDYLTAFGANRVTQINTTTESYLRRILTQAADEGWSYQQTARAITSRYQQFAVGVPQRHIRSRAEMIAVTEVGDAYEEASTMVGVQLQAAGLVMEKFWLHVRAKNVCPLCLGNSAAGWIPFDSAFPSGHTRPLGHPVCRCTVLLRRAPTPAVPGAPAAQLPESFARALAQIRRG